MKLIKWAESKVKAQNVWDVGALKIFCVIVGMVIGANFSVFVMQNIWYFIIAGSVLFVYLMVRFFQARP